MTTAAMTPCGDCGMPCAPNEYHPYAACLMFKACHNSEVVRANLEAVRGSPVVAREVVAWRYVPSKVWGEYVYTEDPKRAQYARDNGIDVQPVCTTPQPTQAQAGAVPKYRMLEPGVDRIDAADEYLQDDAQTWEKDPGGVFVGSIYGGALRPARRVITSLIGITHKEGGQHAE